jgi:hypothetical protein
MPTVRRYVMPGDAVAKRRGDNVPEIYIIPNGDGAWPEIVGRVDYHLGNDAKPIQIALLKAGMGSGKSSVTIRIDLPDGKIVLAETSLALFIAAAEALAACDYS